MTEVARECDHVLRSLDRDKYAEALQILESTLSRHSASPVIDATRSLVYYKMASRIRDCTSTRATYLVKALESSRQAAALAPTSTSCALFHAQVLLRLGEHEAALQECERGVSVETPEEPESTRRIPRDREMTIRSRLRQLKEHSSLKIIVLECGDTSLLEVKNEIETFHQKKKMIVAARSEDFLMEKKVDMKEQWKQMLRLKPFWMGMPSYRRKTLPKIGIKELQAHFAKNNMVEMDLAEKFLQEALDVAKNTRNWRLRMCFFCGVGFPDGPSIRSHFKHAHLGTLSGYLLSMSPDPPGEEVRKQIEDGVWKPEELPWLRRDDDLRERLIEEVHAKLRLFIRSRCLGASHCQKLSSLIVDSLRNHIPEERKIDQILLVNGLRSVCFLEASDLKRVLEWLEDLASACALTCITETLPDDQDIYQGVRAKVCFNRQLSDLHFNGQLLPRDTTIPEDDAKAVGYCTEILALVDVKDDSFFYQLWKGDPPIPERLQTWASVKEAGRSRGLEVYQILVAEFQRLQRLCLTKFKYLRYQAVFERIYLPLRNRRLEGLPQSCASLLVKRWTDINASGEAAQEVRRFELDIIRSILKVSLEDTEIEAEFQRQGQLLDQQLLLLDMFILATQTAKRLTYDELEKLCTYDYRFIVVPMLRSFLKKRLVDIVEENRYSRPGQSL